ncbi:fluoride efflux transporter CrcB [Sphingomonas faeni]|uniref:fluoride efflux transporter CrcB n=1 Tax=Sphingomonas faeni TaxID=185950 RepID=UPI00277F2CCD|nr:fluoride efflux transporter CrcB [Sphingomonas faeni]MDQ0839354.1 CrcB protein [Sphingomonas faeni]
MTYLIVFFGAGIGGALRQFIGLAATRELGGGFPFGTLLINISGSAVMGLVVGVFEARNMQSEALRTFLTTGVLGGYTTFSTFSLDSVTLWERGQHVASFVYVSVTLVASFASVATVMMLARKWT